MLPHVKGQYRSAVDGGHALHEAVVLVVGGGDDELAILFESEPDPARQELVERVLLEVAFEGVEVCEALGNGRRQFARGLSLLDCCGVLEDGPEEKLVEVA